MLTKSVFVSGISNLSDARYCSGMGVNYLGVCVDPNNASYLPLDKFQEINGWLSGINWILEAENMDLEAIYIAYEAYGVKGVYTSSNSAATQLAADGIKVMLNIEENTDLDYSVNITAIATRLDNVTKLVKLKNGGSLTTPIYVSGELTIDELISIRDNDYINGVILTGGLEERPGYKNMDDLIDALEVFEEY